MPPAVSFASVALLALGALALQNGPLSAQGAPASPTADAQSAPAEANSDQLLTMPILQEKGWFIHAHNGRVRACTVDGASVAGNRPAPRCSNWSE